MTVFQTPPEAAATYQVVGVRGSTARSTMRPPTAAGPMLRNSRPAKVEAVMLPFFSSGLPSFFLSPFLSSPFLSSALASFSGTPVFWLVLTASSFFSGPP